MTKLDAMKARLAAATPGPWRANLDGPQPQILYHQNIALIEHSPKDYVAVFADGERIGGHETCRNDADFIAHAREDIELLILIVEAARELIDVPPGETSMYDFKEDRLLDAIAALDEESEPTLDEYDVLDALNEEETP